MLERLNRKVEVTHKTEVFPPWPHDDHLTCVEHADNDFRVEHGLSSPDRDPAQEKFCVMYSGNHSIANPIATVIEAAKRLAEDPSIVFMFIGGGLQKQQVEQAIADGCSNMKSLPYQPIERLSYSLSAADAHVVTVGDDVVGIVHPCKIYGAMSVHRPVLLLGPSESHAGEIVEGDQVGWIIEHGDVDGAEKLLREIAQMSPDELKALGGKASHAVDNKYGKPQLRGAFCDTLEKMMA